MSNKAERWWAVEVNGEIWVLKSFKISALIRMRKLERLRKRNVRVIPVEVRRVSKRKEHPGFSLSRRLPHLWECQACGCEVVTIQEGKRHVRVCVRKK